MTASPPSRPSWSTIPVAVGLWSTRRLPAWPLVIGGGLYAAYLGRIALILVGRR